MEESKPKKQSPKLNKIYLSITVVVAFFFLVFFVFLFLKGSFSTMVTNMVIKEAHFTDDNADVWAEFPGKNNIIIVNNITFLNHRNIGTGSLTLITLTPKKMLN